MTYIEIEADTNDGDYILRVSEISDENLNKIRPLIAAIANFQPYTWVDPDKELGLTWTHYHNYSTSEYIRDDLGEKHPEELYPEFDDEIHSLFLEYCPFGEIGFHSIKSIRIYEKVNEEVLL